MTEAEKARAKYGAFNSTHEVYGVLCEEVTEFFQIVMERPKHGIELDDKRARMIAELNQISAVADRAAHELQAGEIRFV